MITRRGRQRWGSWLMYAGCLLPTLLGGCAASKGAPWTIRCLELQGPYRVEQIQQVAETLKRTPGARAKEVRFTDEPDGRARLYYGTYYRQMDRKTGRHSISRKVREDLVWLRQLSTDLGKPFFRQAMLVRVPTPDVGNPQWALVLAEGVYSLQVAVFEPTDDFWQYKQTAADYCAYLRKRGYEAYYHHTPACSLVTVGSFGPGAVIRRGRGLPFYSDEVVALQREELLKYNVVNGAVLRRKTGEGESVPIPSQLVEIPGAEPSESW